MTFVKTTGIGLRLWLFLLIFGLIVAVIAWQYSKIVESVGPVVTWVLIITGIIGYFWALGWAANKWKGWIF